MRTGWQVKALGEICDIARGGSPRPILKFLTDRLDGVNWIKIGDATASSKYIYKTEERIIPEGIKRSRLVKDGDFLLSNSMSFGRPYIMRTTGCIHDGWLVLSDKSGLFDQDYLYYFLESDAAYRQFDNLAAGSTVRNLNTELVKRVTIPLPPLSEQRRIVAILDEAFARLATATANVEKNLKNVHELFVGHLHITFDARSEQVRLQTLSDEITDGDHSPPPKASSGVPFITISNIVKETREIDFDKTFFVSADYFHRLKPNKKPRVGDILYTVTGATLGIPVLVRNQIDFCFQRHIGLIRPKRDVDSLWLSYALASPYVFAQATAGSTGAAQKTVSLSVLRNMQVPKMSLPEQQAIGEKLDVLAQRTCRLAAAYRQKIESLALLKQSILQKAFSGGLTLPPQTIKEAAE